MTEAYQDSHSERRRTRSRYDRPRRYVSWSALILGVLVGIAGGIFFAWNVAPAEEFDTEPWQLRKDDQAHYVVAIMLAYNHDGNLARTIQQLAALRPSKDPIQYVADVACDLARTGYVSSSSGLNAIRAMMRFYQLQGKQGCADSLIPVSHNVEPTEEIRIAPSPTPQFIPTKTPVVAIEAQITAVTTPSGVVIVPTQPPQSTFRIVRNESFCESAFPGIIEVRVQNGSANPIPGQPIRLKWDEGESLFFNGLMPERGLDYADFQMEPNKGYIIDMPGLAEPFTTQLIASPCTTATGESSIQSYRIWFRPGF